MILLVETAGELTKFPWPTREVSVGASDVFRFDEGDAEALELGGIVWKKDVAGADVAFSLVEED